MKHFLRYWPFVRRILWSSANSPHKGQWRGACMFFYLRLNKRLHKQPSRRWFETPSRSLWRRYNDRDHYGTHWELNKLFLDISMKFAWLCCEEPVSLKFFLPAIQIRWKLRLAIIPLLVVRSQQIFAHATTAQLSCHAQNVIAITVLESRWEWNEISIEFELRWKTR